MHDISRRTFVGGGAALLASQSLDATPLGLPIGCQTYPVREALGKDFEGTLKELAGIGFKTIEMCSPPGYAKSGYGSLLNMKGSEMRQKIHGAGLGCESCHYQFREMKENLDERIAFAKELGLKQMVCSTFSIRQEAPMSEWSKAADELNTIGEKTQKAGIQTAFHNHNIEFKQIDGTLVYDHLLSRLDAKLVKMQFQVVVIMLGFEAAPFFAKHPGRFSSLHLQDWSTAEKKMVAIGQGVVDWKKLFGAAKKAGVKNYYVEMNMDLMKASVPYLRELKGV